MIKAERIANELQPQLEEYWKKVSDKDIIKIKTKAINTPYCKRDAEEFMALRLPARDIPGFGPRDLRIIRPDKGLEIRMIYESWIDSVDDKPYTIPTRWEFTGSKGNKYVVSRNGSMFKCTCPAYKYRKGDCKHIKKICVDFDDTLHKE